MPKCFVPGCLSRWGRKNELCTLHSFPNDIDLVKSWLKQIGYKEPDIKSLVPKIMEFQTRGRYRVCSKHFGKDCYEQRGSGWGLKCGTIPTLYLSLNSLSAGDNEHDYARAFTEMESFEYNAETENTSVSDEQNPSSLSTEKRPSQSTAKCTKEVWSVNSEGELVKTKTKTRPKYIYAPSDSQGPASSRKHKTKPPSRSVATCTEYFPGQRHKSIQFDKHYGCKDKRIQAVRRPLHRSIAIQCKLDGRPRSYRSSQHQLAFNQEQEYTRKYWNMEASNTPDDEQYDEIEVELSPMGADLEESSSRGALSDSDSFEIPQKKKKNRSSNPAPDEEFLKKEMDRNDEIFIDPNDLDNSFLLLPESSEQGNPVTEKKFIVFESCLDELLMSSRCKGNLGCTGSIVRIKKYRVGSALAVMGFCSQGHAFNLWKSQPSIGKMPVGNLLLSAGVLCSGSSFAKVEAMFESIGIYGIGKKTYYNNQKKYLFPTINYHWLQNRQHILDQLGSAPVALSAEGQSGHKAKYCMYSFLEHESKKIIDFQIEQVKPVQPKKNKIGSVSLPAQAFEIGLERILSSRVNVKVLCTDRHVSIRKEMKTKHPDIVHQFDVWRLADSIGNKIVSASKKPSTSALARWVTPAKNHLCWSAKTCNLDPGLLKEQWSSLLYHACNKHQWEDGGRYRQCHHPPLTAEQEQQVDWLVLGSPAHTKLLKIVLNPRLLKDFGKLTHSCHTKELEAFHRTSFKYRPKRNHFSIDGMVARTQLAALDYNNTGHLQTILRETSSTTDEKPPHGFSSEESQHHWVVERVSEQNNQNFILNIIHDTIELACGKKRF